jgi:hypothetical protein
LDSGIHLRAQLYGKVLIFHSCKAPPFHAKPVNIAMPGCRTGRFGNPAVDRCELSVVQTLNESLCLESRTISPRQAFLLPCAGSGSLLRGLEKPSGYLAVVARTLVPPLRDPAPPPRSPASLACTPAPGRAHSLRCSRAPLRGPCGTPSFPARGPSSLPHAPDQLVNCTLLYGAGLIADTSAGKEMS